MSAQTRNSSSSTDGNIVISIGSQAAGKAALLQVKELYMELQKIQREMNVKFLEAQNVMTIANAEAAQDSANADADKAFVQAGSEGAQVLMNGIGAGVESYKKNQMIKTELRDPQTQLENAKNFEIKFNSANPGGSNITDEKIVSPAEQNAQRDEALTKFSDTDRALYQKIVNGRGNVGLEGTANETNVLKQIRAHDEDSKRVSDRINSCKEDANKQINSAYSNFQTEAQFRTRYGSPSLFGGLHWRKRSGR
jgi:hypothetical protein